MARRISVGRRRMDIQSSVRGISHEQVLVSARSVLRSFSPTMSSRVSILFPTLALLSFTFQRVIQVGTN